MPRERLTENATVWIAAAISEVTAGDPLWRAPIAAIASADDPLMERLREAVAPDHLMPRDILATARSVIVFFLPFHRSLAKENIKVGGFASRSWGEAYYRTNLVIGRAVAHLSSRLLDLGYAASGMPATANFDKATLRSRWSHKHVGYVAGLGTFGHNHLFITREGCCGRLGSLVTDAALPPTPRPREEYCLVKAGHACHACVKRCPASALTKEGLDYQACWARLLQNEALFPEWPDTQVCGKCSCEVPCSHGIATRRTERREEEP